MEAKLPYEHNNLLKMGATFTLKEQRMLNKTDSNSTLNILMSFIFHVTLKQFQHLFSFHNKNEKKTHFGL